MSKRSLCCNGRGANLSSSTSVYDIRKEIYQPGYINAIDSTLDYNLTPWTDTCPLGYEQHNYKHNGRIVRRCVYKTTPYPSWYRSYDPWKRRVLDAMHLNK